MLAWRLYGAGFDSLGRGGAPEEVDTPECGADQLLVRHDACGLCFSDTKVIGLGPEHPRMAGRDMRADPVTLGHEVCCTVVEVGDSLTNRFLIGQRFVVQADVFYKGRSMAYGYAIPGGLAEYSVIPKEILEGDEGCYLLPVRQVTGYSEAALTEPWACVVAAYAQEHRSGPEPGGARLIVGSGACDWLAAEGDDPAPHTIALLESDSTTRTAAYRIARPSGSQVVDLAAVPATPDALRAAGPVTRYNDILVLDSAPADLVEAAAALLADNGVLCFRRSRPFDRKLRLDIGRIHYNRWRFVGAPEGDLARAYREARTAELTPGGAVWFIGAGGPMGQMHVQRAVQLPNPPAAIVATDVDEVRLASLVDRLSDVAEARGIRLMPLNPGREPGSLAEAVSGHTGGRGFDDIVCMVPLAGVIEEAATYLARGGWLNIFAGVARGTMATVDVNGIFLQGNRYIGSSGSSLSDMRHTLERVERRELDSNASVAAIGGLRAAREGLLAVKEGRFSGKTMIYPQLHDLPLTTLQELAGSRPGVFALLAGGRFWSREAEAELLREEFGA